MHAQSSSTSSARRTDSSPWLSLPDAAGRVSVSVPYLKREVAANRAPHRHIGRRVVLHRDELDAWANSKPGTRLEAVAS
jgi:excisionase family DNA binding protein